MSATVIPHQPKVRSFESAWPELEASFDAVRLQIAAASSVREAWQLYSQLRKLSAELLELTDRAAQRCDDILERM